MTHDTLIFNIAVFITGIFILDYGADKFIDHTAIVASRLGVSQTLLALLTAGAEWEELAVVIAAVAQHQSPLALGNVIGSTISNILAAFSLGLVFHRGGHVRFDRSSKIYVTLLLVLTIPVTVLGYFGIRGVIFGSILFVVFGLYVVSVGVAIGKDVLAAPEPEDDDDSSDEDSGSYHDNDSNSSFEPEAARSNRYDDTASDEISSTTPLSRAPRHPSRRLRTHIFQLILGFLALSLSGYVISHSATTIASELNISETAYGITILAFATTLPEKFIALLAASRGHSGIVVANTVGSNVFLLTLCLGVVYVSGSSEVGRIIPLELGVALGSVGALAVIVFFGARRWMGWVLLMGYVVFFVLEFTVFRRTGGGMQVR
ncbi:MAG: hypothetical protein Q9225_005218 [Loekoesia sp. 1 TL-2023]